MKLIINEQKNEIKDLKQKLNIKDKDKDKKTTNKDGKRTGTENSFASEGPGSLSGFTANDAEKLEKYKEKIQEYKERIQTLMTENNILKEEIKEFRKHKNDK